MEGSWCIEYNILVRKHTLVTMSTTVLSHIHTHTQCHIQKENKCSWEGFVQYLHKFLGCWCLNNIRAFFFVVVCFIVSSGQEIFTGSGHVTYVQIHWHPKRSAGQTLAMTGLVAHGQGSCPSYQCFGCFLCRYVLNSCILPLPVSPFHWMKGFVSLPLWLQLATGILLRSSGIYFLLQMCYVWR